MEAAVSGPPGQQKMVRDLLYANMGEVPHQRGLTTHAQNVPISRPKLAAKAKNFTFLLGREI